MLKEQNAILKTNHADMNKKSNEFRDQVNSIKEENKHFKTKIQYYESCIDEKQGQETKREESHSNDMLVNKLKLDLAELKDYKNKWSNLMVESSDWKSKAKEVEV